MSCHKIIIRHILYCISLQFNMFKFSNNDNYITKFFRLSFQSANDDNKIYGVISYIAPEILQRKEYTIALDIYGFGMIMWELMTGRMPFWNKIQDTELIIEICDGLRPPIVTNAPENYIELMQECWNSDSDKRPTAFDIRKKLINIEKVEMENL